MRPPILVAIDQLSRGKIPRRAGRIDQQADPAVRPWLLLLRIECQLRDVLAAECLTGRARRVATEYLGRAQLVRYRIGFEVGIVDPDLSPDDARRLVADIERRLKGG